MERIRMLGLTCKIKIPHGFYVKSEKEFKKFSSSQKRILDRPRKKYKARDWLTS